jgi:Family of unknown function (DUF6298)/Putative collagen-binding domain of a collagenase
MSIFSWSRFRKFISLFWLFLIVFFLLLNFSKLSRVAQKFSQAERSIGWILSPTVVVKVGDNTLTKALPKIRTASATGSLRINAANRRYFTDGSGKAIYLTGSHTWTNNQDGGFSDPPSIFDYTAYLNFLQTNNHNFFRLWTWEQPRWSLETARDLWNSPMSYLRTGPGNAQDGKPKFDLTHFNQAYFDRLHERVKEASDRGIYVSVMLFNGWSVASDKGTRNKVNPWKSHPFNRANNINNIDGDPDSNNSGEETHTLALPSVTAIQETYVRKVIDTVNDLSNVLYEISNESHSDSRDWQYHIINYIKKYELGKPKQHPVGMTAAYPNGDNSALFASPADWISPNGDANNPPVNDGSKVIFNDTDHLCGICGDQKWVWKSFTRGGNLPFMDPYNENGVARGVGPLHYLKPNDPNWVSIRRNLGYTLTYANRMNLVAMTPRGDLASTEYCLANPTPSKAEYLIYSPTGGTAIVDLSGVQGKLLVEWLNPSNGMITTGITTTGGGNRSFVPPFEGDAVLYVYQESIN